MSSPDGFHLSNLGASTCHILKMSHVPWQVDFLPFWPKLHIAITFAYRLCFSIHLHSRKYYNENFTIISFSWAFDKFDFWSFQDPFGSHLPTKTFWSSKRVLTRHQVRDRPPHLFSVFKLCHMHLSHQDQLQNNHDNWQCIVSHLYSFTSYLSHYHPCWKH